MRVSVNPWDPGYDLLSCQYRIIRKYLTALRSINHSTFTVQKKTPPKRG